MSDDHPIIPNQYGGTDGPALRARLIAAGQLRPRPDGEASREPECEGKPCLRIGSIVGAYANFELRLEGERPPRRSGRY